MAIKGQNKILVLILTLNEELHISKVIEDVKKTLSDADILVVDGESLDNTQELAKGSGAYVISVPNKLGIGGGMEAGLLFAYHYDYDYIIRMDGDGQHAAKEIDRIFQPVHNQTADIAIGSRFINKDNSYKSSFIRLLANKLFSSLITLLIGQKVCDTTSGFQVINKKAVKFLCRIENFEYSEVTTLILLKKSGYKILEVPVKMNPRIGNKSSFTFVRAFFYVFDGLFSLLLNIKQKR